MPISKYYGGHGSEVMNNMEREYGPDKGKRVFYATLNKRKQQESGSPKIGKGIKRIAPVK